MILVSEEFRQRLFVDIPLLQKTLDESKKALIPLQEEQKELEGKIIQKEKELNELKKNIFCFFIIWNNNFPYKFISFIVDFWKV